MKKLLFIFTSAGLIPLLSACANEIPSNVSESLKIYVESGCARCHELDLRGGPNGPDLAGVHERWNRQDLIDYIDNPNLYENDDRLQELSYQYPEPMPSMPINDEKVEKIADFIIERSKEISANEAE